MKTQECRAEKRDAIHNAVEIFFGALARADAWNETPALLKILRDLLGIECDRGIEIRKDKYEQEIEYAVIQSWLATNALREVADLHAPRRPE